MSPSGVAASGILNDGSGSANPFPFHFTQDPNDSLTNYTHPRIHWPKDYGRPTVPSATKCKTYTPPGPASASWQCVLELPNSFNKDDGIQLRVSAEAPTKDDTDEHACRLAFLHLLTENPHTASAVGTLSHETWPAHWNISIEELLKNMPHSLPAHQALPVYVNAKPRIVPGPSKSVGKRHILKLLQKILTRHGGSLELQRCASQGNGSCSNCKSSKAFVFRLLCSTASSSSNSTNSTNNTS